MWEREAVTPGVRNTLTDLGIVGLLLWGAAGCAAPGLNEDEWAQATPAESGMDEGLVQRLDAAVTGGAYQNLHGVIVVKHGRLVLEAYAPGVDSEDLHYTASVTKSVGSILLGMVMDHGLMPGLEHGVLDLPVSELFPRHEAPGGDFLLRHVLSMTAGLAWDEDSYPYDDARNDWVRVRDADDPVEMVFRQAMHGEPGTEFVYSGGMSTLVGWLLESATGGDPRAFAEAELFEPMGISEYEWWNLAGGLIDVPGGLSLRPRDMAKIGQMALQGGIWRGHRVVSEAWIAESTRAHVSNDFSPDYGLHWWVGDHNYQARSAHMFMASGHGGQRIIVIPEFDMVVVIVQQVFDNPMADANNLSIMTQYLLPAAGGIPVPFDPERDDLALYAAVAGEYTSPRGNFALELRGDTLWATEESAPPMALHRVGSAAFRGTAMGLIEVDFEFDLDPDGVVRGGRARYGFTRDDFKPSAGGL